MPTRPSRTRPATTWRRTLAGTTHASNRASRPTQLHGLPKASRSGAVKIRVRGGDATAIRHRRADRAGCRRRGGRPARCARWRAARAARRSSVRSPRRVFAAVRDRPMSSRSRARGDRRWHSSGSAIERASTSTRGGAPRVMRVISPRPRERHARRDRGRRGARRDAARRLRRGVPARRLSFRQIQVGRRSAARDRGARLVVTEPACGRSARPALALGRNDARRGHAGARPRERARDGEDADLSRDPRQTARQGGGHRGRDLGPEADRGGEARRPAGGGARHQRGAALHPPAVHAARAPSGGSRWSARASPSTRAACR